MDSIIPFRFEESSVRVVKGEDGEPWFVGKDVAEVLGYTNPNKAMNDHCKGVTKRYPLQTQGGIQEVRLIPESDVLRLVVKSKLPSAVRFERWVFEEVLPSIRKSGQYVHHAQMAASLTRMDLIEIARQAESERLVLESKLNEQAPKLAYLERIMASPVSRTFTEAAKELGYKRNYMTDLMHRNKWVYRLNGSWVAYSEKIRAGMLEYKEAHYTHESTGQTEVRPYCHITPKGMQQLAKELFEQDLL